MPSSTPNWAHGSSLEISLCFVIIWHIKKVIWPTKLGEKLIFPRSLQRCINSPETIVFMTFLQNHDTCVKSEGNFYSLVCFGWKHFSVFPNSSLIAQKHHLSETYRDVWDKGFAEMKWNEGDMELLNSLGNFGRYGGMLGSRGKWNLKNWVKGRGPKRKNTGPTIENCLVVARN